MGKAGRIIGRVSAVLDPVLSSAWLTRLVGVEPVRLRYTARRSGRVIELKVWAKPTERGLDVDVGAASSKSWWRNFRTPQPIEARRHGAWHRGTGLVDESQGTIVRISLDD